MHAALALFAVALLGKAAHVQLWQQGRWAARAARQQEASRPLPAPRGEILDAAGEPLAQNRDMLRIDIAPREIRDRAAVRRRLERLGIPRHLALRATDRRRVWASIPGVVEPSAAGALASMRGVYVTPVVDRVYTMPRSLAALVGRVDPQRGATAGIELALDTILRGRAGWTRVLRHPSGRSLDSPTGRSVEPVRGRTIVLTLHKRLQEIAERALDEAVDRLDATGGDVVVLDPHSGEIRAMASRRRGVTPATAAATAITEPFEPGSTIKPFIAAALLNRRRARADDVVETDGGELAIDGRTIRDVHRAASPLRLADVLKWSSNVGIVRFSERLEPAEQYETLRDFGFGVTTGVTYPSEAAGRLRPPAAWSRQSQASIAMGYEIAVTPLQLAVAYASFANGGELIEPTVVKEIRNPDGGVAYRHQRRVVRRVMSPETARDIRGMLVDVVTGGTAVGADLGTFHLAGKTGTARRAIGGRYVADQYFASFAGLFPAHRPQFVVVVKLDSPQGDYFGGATAAPVSKALLEAALAARDAALDRSALAVEPSRRVTASNVAVATAGRDTTVNGSVRLAGALRTSGAERDAAHARRAVYALPYRGAKSERAPLRAVPDVRGAELRDAVRALHGAGFRVHLAHGPGGRAGGTSPAAGVLGSVGSLVRLFRE